MTAAHEERSQFGLGWDANHKGLKLDDNPHTDSDSLGYESWQAGWLACERKKKLGPFAKYPKVNPSGRPKP